MQFKLIKEGETAILRLNDDNSLSSIPHDEGNRDWNAYLAWVAEGGVPLNAEDDWE